MQTETHGKTRKVNLKRSELLTLFNKMTEYPNSSQPKDDILEQICTLQNELYNNLNCKPEDDDSKVAHMIDYLSKCNDVIYKKVINLLGHNKSDTLHNSNHNEEYKKTTTKKDDLKEKGDSKEKEEYEKTTTKKDGLKQEVDSKEKEEYEKTTTKKDGLKEKWDSKEKKVDAIITGENDLKQEVDKKTTEEDDLKEKGDSEEKEEYEKTTTEEDDLKQEEYEKTTTEEDGLKQEVDSKEKEVDEIKQTPQNEDNKVENSNNLQEKQIENNTLLPASIISILGVPTGIGVGAGLFASGVSSAAIAFGAVMTPILVATALLTTLYVVYNKKMKNAIPVNNLHATHKTKKQR